MTKLQLGYLCIQLPWVSPVQESSRVGFLNLGTTDSLGQMILSRARLSCIL